MTISRKITMLLTLLMLLSAFAVLGVACVAKDGAIPQLRPDNAVEITNRFYEEHKLQDAQGNVVHVKAHKTIFVPRDAQRVVLFGVGDMDTYLQLGLQDKVVGRAVLSGMPTDVEDAFPIITLGDFNSGKPGVVGVSGSGITDAPHDPDYDKIIELEPDLIIIEGRQRSGRNSSGHFQRLSAIAPTLDFGLSSGQVLQDNRSNLQDIAKIYETKAELVQQAIDNINTQIQDIKTISSINNPKTLMILKNGESYSFHGQSGRWSMVYNELGLTESIGELSNQAHGTPMTPSLVQDNSDNIEMILFVDNTGNGNKNSILEHDFFKNVPAVLNNLVFDLDMTWYFVSGGIQNLLNQIQEISTAVEAYNEFVGANI
ncbi:MAG: ABC transporter substrate-binding protein [Clostridiales bacterium]|jgi:iron complex transport system substrate-binding protein|nr:ABC transporter substrate-binding protein [Clostridiales bacterium]